MPRESAQKEASDFKAQLFKAADKLRKNINAANYKDIVLGLVFLKHISDSFEEFRKTHESEEDFDPEDRDEYIAKNIFFVPTVARWHHLHDKARLPTIGIDIDNAMEAIEKENPRLRGVLPKVYAHEQLDKTSLGELIDLVSDMNLKAKQKKTGDLFGDIYEYFLGEFANAEGQKWGQFYTPKAIVKLMVEMIEPYKGRIYDPACGSGGMFIMSKKFVKEHQGNFRDVSIYGQESNQTTWKLSKMNLAIRHLDSQFVSWNTEGSFLHDMHPDLKADYVLANPPFNQSDWGQESLQDDARWKYGVPPSGNANFAWIQHMLYHLAPHGVMATVLANGSLSSNTSGEGEIRKKLILADLIDCIVALPKQLFFNTGIPACIWFLRRGRTEQTHNETPQKGWNVCENRVSKRGVHGAYDEWGTEIWTHSSHFSGVFKTLFIDASEMGYMKDRVHRDLSDEDIQTIADTYHRWRKGEGYEDRKGFSYSASLADIEKHSFVLTPWRYVGIVDAEDDGVPFAEKMAGLTRTLSEQMTREKELDEEIKIQLAKIGFTL